MSIMKRILKWIVDIGIKFVTKLVRTASEMSGTPKSKVIEPVRNFVDRCRGITPLLDKDRVSYAKDPGLVIDV